jgi:hypothetical protein
VEVPDAQAVCQEDDSFRPGSCATSLEVLVHNCGVMDISVLGMKLHLKNKVMLEWTTDDVVIPPGETWTRDGMSGPDAGEYSMEVHLMLGESADAWEWVDFKVINAQMSAAMQACDDCNGQWGPHGISGTVGCLCRTGDAGTACDDGKDCEGKCISTDGQFECSEFFSVFGCHSYLPYGWSEETHESPTNAPFICVD